MKGGLSSSSGRPLLYAVLQAENNCFPSGRDVLHREAVVGLILLLRDDEDVPRNLAGVELRRA